MNLPAGLVEVPGGVSTRSDVDATCWAAISLAATPSMTLAKVWSSKVTAPGSFPVEIAFPVAVGSEDESSAMTKR